MKIKFLFPLALCTFISACGSEVEQNSESKNALLGSSLRSAGTYCEAGGVDLDLAKTNYSNSCTLPRVDCDPVNGAWVCSSEKIGSFNPVSPITAAVVKGSCIATGDNLGSAVAAYSASCSLPRLDCDPISGAWVCSSSNIDSMAIAAAVPFLPSMPSVSDGSTCVAEGSNLDEAKNNFAASCSIPRLDCDQFVGVWQCSGMQIGSARPGFVGAPSVALPTIVNAETTNVVVTGFLIDSPVAGVFYSTETQQGITNGDGAFKYIPGETVNFSAGPVLLGSAEANVIVTPFELANSYSLDDENLIKRLQLIQSLDSDLDPTNGITYEAAMLSSSVNPLSFRMAVTADGGIDEQLALLEEQGLVIVSAEVAVAHFDQTASKIIDGTYQLAGSVLEDTAGIAINAVALNQKINQHLIDSGVELTENTVDFAFGIGEHLIISGVDLANGTIDLGKAIGEHVLDSGIKLAGGTVNLAFGIGEHLVISGIDLTDGTVDLTKTIGEHLIDSGIELAEGTGILAYEIGGHLVISGIELAEGTVDLTRTIGELVVDSGIAVIDTTQFVSNVDSLIVDTVKQQLSNELSNLVSKGVAGRNEANPKLQLQIAKDYGEEAYLAGRIYDDGRSQLAAGIVVFGWVLEDLEIYPSGMKAGLYKHELSERRAIVFAGTGAADSYPTRGEQYSETVKDIIADATLLNWSSSPQQVKDVDDFLMRDAVYEAKDTENIAFITGHSLGGGLAQYLGLRIGLQTVTFNTAPLPLSQPVHSELINLGVASDSLVGSIAFEHEEKIVNIVRRDDPLTLALELFEDLDKDSKNKEEDPLISVARNIYNIPPTLNIDYLLNGRVIVLPAATDAFADGHSMVLLNDWIRSVYKDTDFDTITDSDELELGLNPRLPDSDGDNIPDGKELDPINNPVDSDNDGVIDPLDPANTDPCEPSIDNAACSDSAPEEPAETEPKVTKPKVTNVESDFTTNGLAQTFSIKGENLPVGLVVELDTSAGCNIVANEGAELQKFRCLAVNVENTATTTVYLTVTFNNEELGRFPITVLRPAEPEPEFNSGIAIKAITNGFELKWSPAVGDVTSYKVYRSIFEGSRGALIYSGLNLTTTNTSLLEDGQRYFYVVQACNGTLCTEGTKDSAVYMAEAEVTESESEPEPEPVVPSYDDVIPTNYLISGESSRTFKITGSNIPTNITAELEFVGVCTVVGTINSDERSFNCPGANTQFPALALFIKSGNATVKTYAIEVRQPGIISPSPIVTMVTPVAATVGVPVTFAITGSDLPNTIAASLSGTGNCSITSYTVSLVEYTCIPQSAGEQKFFVAAVSGGDAIEGTPEDILVAPEPPIVTNVEPLTAVLGEEKSFTITGRNLPSTITTFLGRPGTCTIESFSPTEVVTLCTPAQSGIQNFAVSSEEVGIALNGSRTLDAIEVSLPIAGQDEFEILGTWISAGAVDTNIGLTSFNTTLEISSSGVLYTETFTLNSDCGFLSATTSFETDYEYTDETLAVILRNDVDNVVEGCTTDDGVEFYVQTSKYSSDERINYLLSSQAAPASMLSENCGVYQNGDVCILDSRTYIQQ